jgi:TonB family protein
MQLKLFLSMLATVIGSVILYSQPTKRPLPPTKYFIDATEDGKFDSLIAKPELSFLQMDFDRKLIRAIKYPSPAKENGISGVVTLEVYIDESGFVLDIKIKQSLSGECDQADINAFRETAKDGYAILKSNSKPTQYLMEISMGFWL